ncbi:MAG: CBS domain-containing protein [Allosphingosinicella sp.]
MTIAAILSGKGKDVASIASDAPLTQAVAELGTRRIGCLLVMDGGEISGILSERDLIYCLTANGAEVLDWPVSRAMTSPPIVIAPDTEVLSALALMTQRRIRHLPVVSSSGELLGLVSIGDLVKYRIERIEAEAEAMRTYIQTA